MKAILVFMMLFNVATGCSSSATVDRIEVGETDYAVVEVYHNGETKMVNIAQEDFNVPKSESEKLDFSMAVGRFTSEFANLQGNQCYQFKSYDGEVWWCLEVNEIGFIPTMDKKYTLLYYDNGTTKGSKPCYCLPEWDCECEVYDDIFLGIFEEEQK